LTRDVMGGLYSWRPLVQLSFGLNEATWGVHPFGYRLEVLAWQAVAAGALYAIATRLSDRLRGGLAALLFAVHPVQVESVSWTCARGGPLATALLLGALLAYLAWRHDQDRRGVQLWMVLVPFALALATLESSVTFVGVVLATDVLLPGPAMRIGHRLQVYVGLIAVVVGFLGLRHVSSPAATTMNMIGLDEHWPANAGQMLAFALQKLQAIFAMLFTVDGQPEWVAAALAAATAVAAALGWWRGRRLGLWGLIWIIVAGAPFTLLLLGPAPRQLHLATVGFGLLLADLVVTMAEIAARRSRHLGAVCVAALMVLWLGQMVRKIDDATALLVERGRLTAALLDDLQRLVPQPRPGSELVFEGLGDLRVEGHVFVYGLEDAVRVIYDDGSLRTSFGARGAPRTAAYRLLYDGGHLALLGGARS